MDIPSAPDGHEIRKRGLTVPWWVRVLLGAACAALGLVLLFSPAASLTVLVSLLAAALLLTALVEAASALKGGRGNPWVWLAALTCAVAGVAVAAWPGPTLTVLAYLVGAALVVSGLARLVRALRGRTDERVADLLSALATMVFGALALSWPDVTTLVIAVVFGARTAWFGAAHALAAWRNRHSDTQSAASMTVGQRRRGWRRWARTLTSAAVLALALILLTVSTALQAASPKPTAFYQPPSGLPATPGALLRSEPYTNGVPSNARGWLILYTTTRDDHTPAVASAVVVAAKTLPAGPRPVIAWAHGTTGIAEGCAPSLLKKSLASGALPGLDQIVAHGWVLVATDYIGLGTAGPHPYLIGQGEARSVLDAVRATRHLTDVTVSDRTLVWGHSQGGNAALWTGLIQPTYAPDVPLAGVAALAPASNLTGLVAGLPHVTGGSLFAAYTLTAYTQTYPDVKADAYLTPAARTIVAQTATRCLGEPEVFVSIGTALLGPKNIFSTDPTTGAFGARLRENSPTGRIQAPVLLGQGGADPLVLPAVQSGYARASCAAGTHIDYRVYAGRDHVGVVADDSPLIPELLAWTSDRINGQPAPDTCPT